MVGRYWDHAKRVAYVAEIRAEQDKLIPQIEALGGKIRGRFAQASAGLAVEIDAAQLDAVRAIGGVLAVRGVANYQLDLSETVPFIGAEAVAEAGNDGTGVDVAVIDSGIDFSHVKLGGPGTVEGYALAYCGDASATPDPFNTDGNCNAFDFPDTTGFFGDPNYGRDGSPVNKVVGGWDWVGEVWPFGPTSSDPNPIDFEGHGTHVSDIIGGLESAPGADDEGVAPGVNLWHFKGCSAVSSSCEGLALLLSVDDALDLDDSDYGACTPGFDPYCLTYDPADVINMSLGSIYGQPEDDLTLFTNIATFYGSLAVVSAGNSGDIPYIVGSPSAAEGALSVAQSTVPSDGVYGINAGSVTASGVLQPWSPAPAGELSGVLQYGNGAGGNLNGCAAFPAGSLDGKVLLVDRGGCNNSIKGSNGAAGGAEFVVIANNVPSNTAPVFGFGGGDPSVPTFTVTLNEGNVLKTVLGATASVSPESFASRIDDIVASSSRGPRIADGDIKPDIAAPGASVSAEVGTGSEKTAFGGTSGAAPMVSGAAALVVKELEDRGILDSDPGLDGVGSLGLSFSYFVKSILMNNANNDTFIGGSFKAPITLQGAGRVDAAKATTAETVVTDQTDFQNWFASGEDGLCQVLPAVDVFFFTQFGLPPDCADDFPFGNDFFNAWNSTTGSLSFGYMVGAARGRRRARWGLRTGATARAPTGGATVSATATTSARAGRRPSRRITSRSRPAVLMKSMGHGRSTRRNCATGRSTQAALVPRVRTSSAITPTRRRNALRGRCSRSMALLRSMVARTTPGPCHGRSCRRRQRRRMSRARAVAVCACATRHASSPAIPMSSHWSTLAPTTARLSTVSATVSRRITHPAFCLVSTARQLISRKSVCAPMWHRAGTQRWAYRRHQVARSTTAWSTSVGRYTTRRSAPRITSRSSSIFMSTRTATGLMTTWSSTSIVPSPAAMAATRSSSPTSTRRTARARCGPTSSASPTSTRRTGSCRCLRRRSVWRATGRSSSTCWPSMPTSPVASGTARRSTAVSIISSLRACRSTSR
ncbi:S8 family serine peptidase [Candidatus Gracilibacteria bacterium]|nr:S8 family serine peptidase [Candidatus Gracilibacteria bacterium]